MKFFLSENAPVMDLDQFFYFIKADIDIYFSC
jgi:hypothetical protein